MSMKMNMDTAEDFAGKNFQVISSVANEEYILSELTPEASSSPQPNTAEQLKSVEEKLIVDHLSDDKTSLKKSVALTKNIIIEVDSDEECFIEKDPSSDEKTSLKKSLALVKNDVVELDSDEERLIDKSQMQEDVEPQRTGGKPVGRKKQQKLNKEIEKKRLLQHGQAQELAVNVLKKPKTEMDEFSAFGFTVGSKLQNMELGQRLLSELLINKVIYFGMTGQLSENSEVSLNNQFHGNGGNRCRVRGLNHAGLQSSSSSQISPGSASNFPSDEVGAEHCINSS